MNRKLIAFGYLFLLASLKVIAQGPVSNFSATPTAGCGPLHVQFTDQSTNGPLFWNWDFGDGNSSTAQSPLNVYANPGTYTVTLTTRNRDGVNTATKTGYITVYSYPTAGFTSNLTTACNPSTIQFTSTSYGQISSYEWDLGDGTTSNLPNPAHTYSQTGYYNISLTVSNAGGCSNISSQTRYLRIIDGIQPAFMADQVSTSCTAPYVVNFVNQTAGPGTLTYNWTLGNGASPATSTSANPSNITYPADGSYTVSLQVQSSLGCSQSIQKTIPFNGATATFTAPATVCVNTPASFANTSSPTPTSTTWNFGDGTTAGGLNTSKTWSTPGNYPVKMVNKNANCADSTIKTVKVVTPPVAAFSANPTSSCKAPLIVNFSDNSTGSPNKWLWDFGDGHTDTTQNPAHTYTAAGTYNVTLTASSASGCSNVLTKTAFITITAPVVTINNANTLGACVNGTGANFTVKPTATYQSVDMVTGYNWQAPGSNEGSSTSATPSFTYNTAGNYTISVTVTTQGGCTSASATSTVTIGTSVPANFTPNPNPVCGSGLVTFTATASTPPADHWNWDFGDGTISGVQTLPTITHTYTQIDPTPFKVILTTIHNGCPTNSTPTLITVSPPLPKFGYKVNCANTLEVSFIDSSFTSGNPGVAYSWDFGDAGTSTSQTPTHTYAGPGSYTVKLTITDPGSSCGPQTATKQVGLSTVALNIIAPPSACKNSAVLLQSSITTNPNDPNFISDINWFLDGALSGQKPTDTIDIADNGTHTILLQLTDRNGCNYNTSKNISIVGPKADFSYPASGGGCKNGPAVTFTDNSTVDPTTNSPLKSWTWDWGDISTTTFNAAPFTHIYADTGTYSVKMAVTDAQGCTDFLREPGTILITSPMAKFAGPDSFYCPGVPFTFSDSSKGYQLTESWNFGDGSPLSSSSTHTYTTSNNYNVTLTLTDTFSCTNSFTKSIKIQKPISAFDIADTLGICIPTQTFFTSKGQFYDSLYWDFGDGSTSTLPVTSHFYNSYGVFDAVLWLRGPGGCYDTTGRIVRLLDPDANTQFNYSPLEACDSVVTQFDITPPPYTSFSIFFGDGLSDTSQNGNIVHVYHNPNMYHPAVVLTDVTGCVYTIGGLNRVTVLGASPFFSMNPHSFCDSAIVNMIDFTQTNDGIDSETYVFSNGLPPQTQTPGTGAFNISAYFNQPGTFLVTLKTVTDHGCKESYTDTVRSYQTPHPLITLTSYPCQGLVQFSGSLDAPIVDTIGWNWNFGNGQTSELQNPSVNLPAGTYTITLRAAVSFGCADTTSGKFTIFPPPLIKGPNEITTPLGVPVTIPFTYSSSVVTYNWTPATNLDCSTCPNPVATLLLATQYQVTVTDTNHCTATDTILIKTICNDQNYWLPNTFSPNGDGVNDYFYPRGTNLYNIQSLTIFNRWGQMVFQRRDFPANAQNLGWDGTFNGHPAPADAYVYIAEVICENAQTIAIHGNVTLVR